MGGYQMMNGRFRLILLPTLLLIAGLACQMTQISEKTVTPTSQSASATSTPVIEIPTSEATLAQATPTSEPQKAVSPVIDKPEDAEAAYLEALKQRDFEQVAALVSDYSISVDGVSRRDVVSFFEKKDFDGWKLVDYRVKESRLLDDQSALVYVMTKEQSGEGEPQSDDFWVAIRKENGQWRVNWALLVDELVLNVESQTVNNVSIQPMKIIRYTNKMRLFMRVENANDRGCFWGWVNDEIATFHFGDQPVGVSGSLGIEPDRTYPDVYVDINGFYETYPMAVSLSKWRWASETSPDLPDPGGASWAYAFDLQGNTP